MRTINDLTKEEKIEILYSMRYYIKSTFVVGLCSALRNVTSMDGSIIDLGLEKPSTSGLWYWWPKGEKTLRIKAIDKAIKKLEDEN